MLYYQQHHSSQLILKQLPPFQRVTTPLPLRGGAGGEALFIAFLLNNYCISFHTYMVSLTRKEAFGNLLCKEYIPDWRLTELT